MLGRVEPEGLPGPLRGLERPLVFGVLNVTPDSFSDGGLHIEPGEAVSAGLRMRAEGADVVDIGGESTRPGADRVPAADELARVLPVVSALAGAGVPVSIDTMRAEVAVAAVAAGAAMVNDVSGGLADPEMLDALAGLDVPYILMHWRGHSRSMDSRSVYADVVAEVCDELAERLHAVDDAGIDRARVVLDPGLGFAKGPEHNWALLHGLERLGDLGRPLLVGASRKRFLGAALADDAGPREVSGREAATVAISALAAAAGVWAVRVHEVRANADAVVVGQHWRTGA